MVRLDRKKTREKGVPVVDFQYVFFGRHKGNNAVKYLTVFVFLIILISVAAFWMQAPAATNTQQKSQNQPAPQPQAESAFTPVPDGKYAPKLIIINNASAWEYTLPEGTWIAAADNGDRYFTFDYGSRIVIPSVDGKWMLSYSTKNSPEKPLTEGQKILKGTKLFVVGSEKVGQSENSNFIFQVIKITPECKANCYIDPQEYFNSLK